jgi:hypothetical protein
VPRHYDERRPYGDERVPGFDVRSVLIQNRVNRGRYNRDGYDRGLLSRSGVVVSGPECLLEPFDLLRFPPTSG